MSNLDQMFDFFVTLTSNELKKSFDSEEAEMILSRFSNRFQDLYTQIKETFNETELFHGINPIFVIAIEEALPGEEGKKDPTIVLRHMLSIYRTMLEDFVLEPQRRIMASSKDPWTEFVTTTRNGNQKIYDNEYFQLKEVHATDEEFSFDINRCIYQEVFKQFDRADLGPLMCGYDTIIAENLSQWVRFEREETIAEGCNRCTFRFFNIKRKFSENPIIDTVHSFLQIIDDSDEMLTQQELKEKGLDAEIDVADILKLIELVKNHPGINTSSIKEELVVGTATSFRRHEEWKQLFNRKLPKEVRSKIIQELPLSLKKEKIIKLISDILDNPYELSSIQWVCLNYLQYHFSARVGFEAEGIDELQLKAGLLEEFGRNYPEIFFSADSLDNTKVSVQAFGKGVPEYKLKEPIQLLRKKIVNQYPDAGISTIKPVISLDPVAKKFFEIFEDTTQNYQLRELALRILISRVGNKLVPYLKNVAENKQDDQFLRGRAIDSLAWFTSTLPRVYESFDDFAKLPNPIQRSVVDFIARQGIEQKLLIEIASDRDCVSIIIRMIALRNLQTYVDPGITKFLVNFVNDRTQDDRVRQAALEALGKHDVDTTGVESLFELFKDQTESTFIRMEIYETLRELNFKPKDQTQLPNPDWITNLGIKQLMKGY